MKDGVTEQQDPQDAMQATTTGYPPENTAQTYQILLKLKDARIADLLAIVEAKNEENRLLRAQLAAATQTSSNQRPDATLVNNRQPSRKRRAVNTAAAAAAAAASHISDAGGAEDTSNIDSAAGPKQAESVSETPIPAAASTSPSRAKRRKRTQALSAPAASARSAAANDESYNPSIEKKKPPPKKSCYEDNWDEVYQELVEFKEQHDRFPTREENLKLGKFFETMRRYNKSIQKGEVEEQSIESRVLTPERIEKLESLGVFQDRTKRKAKRKTKNSFYMDNFDELYPKLVEFRQIHNRLTAKGMDPHLTKFYNTMRAYYKTHLAGGDMPDTIREFLAPERVEKLEALGFKESVRGPRLSIDEDNWDELYQELVEFKQQHNRVPRREVNHRLANFYDTMRRYFRLHLQGKDIPSDVLTPERIEKLKVFGFKEKITLPSQDPWETRYEELKEYKRTNGDFRVSRHDNPQLWGWIKTQRARYRNFRNQFNQQQENTAGTNDAGDNNYNNNNKKSNAIAISPEHMAKLQLIGFEWEIQTAGYEASWEQRFMELLQYKSEFGNTIVPRGCENQKLAQWVKDMRRKFAKLQAGKPSTLTDEQMERLNSIDFEWRVRW